MKLRIYDASDRRSTATRIFIWNAKLDDDAVRKQILPSIVRKIGSSGLKATFSRYAACACGCSPCFVVHDDKRRDVHVDM